MGKLEGKVGGGWLGLLKFGLFLVLIGIIVGITPNVIGDVADFLGDLRLQQIYPHIFFLLPAHNHATLYYAAFLFCVGWCAIQGGFLVAHLAMRDRIKSVRTLPGVVFWFGLACIIFYLVLRLAPFTSVLGYFIILLGITIMIRALKHI